MKRFLTAILCAGALFASVLGNTGAFSARAEGGAPSENRADAEALSDILLLPDSYEQYLPLTAPSDVAVSKDYMAIADGSRIYIYDRVAEEYRLYEHAENPDEETNTITKLQFSDAEDLYFLDMSNCLYSLAPSSLEVQKSELHCSNFTIYSDVIYFINIPSTLVPAKIRKTTLQKLSLSQSETAVDFSIVGTPALAQDKGVLYYTDSGRYLHKTENDYSETPSLAKADATVISLAVCNGILYYTDSAGVFYVYDLTTNSELSSLSGGYAALSVYDGYVYAVQNDTNTIKQYSTAEGCFTDYEIGASSDSENRLSGAEQTILVGGLLVTADNGNARISVYDTGTRISRTFPCTLSPSYLASDGETLLAANASSAALYDLGSGGLISSFSGFVGSVAGIADVYGNYYFVTDNNYFYSAEQSGEGEWTLKASPKPSVSHTARLLARDIYGELYVAYSDGSVYRFDREEFMTSAEAGETVCTVPLRTEKFAVDYEQTVYALCENKLYVCADVQTSYSLGKSLLYSQTEETTVVSFAFGVEDGGVCLLYDGDFVIKTYDIPLPNMSEIAVNGADEKIFSNENAEFSVVKTAENAIMVNFDIGKLSGAEYFPYLSYVRETEIKTALKLGETEKYNLIAVFDETEKSYSTALVLKRYCEELPRGEYLKSPVGFENNVGYLTNAVTLYKYPYLTGLLTVCELPKNAAVTVLGEVDRLDYRYYYVSYTDETGAERTGYVPKAYLTAFDGSPPGSELIQYGDSDTDWDSIWRMAFMLLGCASVCILIDYLILHKKKD